MILEHYENTGNKAVDYDEDKGKFTVKNKFLWFFNIGNTDIDEKDISIKKLNEMKEQADKTTLSDYDINMLYQFAKLQFKYTKSQEDFVHTPLKDLFPGLSHKKLKTNELMPLAYEYVQAQPQERPAILEKFTPEGINMTKQEDTQSYLVTAAKFSIICLILILICFCLYWLKR